MKRKEKEKPVSQNTYIVMHFDNGTTRVYLVLDDSMGEAFYWLNSRHGEESKDPDKLWIDAVLVVRAHSIQSAIKQMQTRIQSNTAP